MDIKKIYTPLLKWQDFVKWKMNRVGSFSPLMYKSCIQKEPCPVWIHDKVHIVYSLDSKLNLYVVIVMRSGHLDIHAKRNY